MNEGKTFDEMAKGKFSELEKKEKELKMQLVEVQKQKKPLKTYLQSAGLIEVKRRGPRRKKIVAEGAEQ